VPTTYRVLGQVAPVAEAFTDLYTPSSGVETVISTLVIANRSDSTAGSYRIIISPDGETLSDKHYLAFNVPIAAGDSTTMTLGLTLNAGDKLIVYSGNNNLSFSLFGMEITA
jgi:hypothetical protein